MNVEWALGELDEFIAATVLHYVPSPSGTYGFHSYKTSESDEEVLKKAQIVEQILDMVIPGWREYTSDDPYENRWEHHREIAIRAREALLRDQEIRENLGENAPELSASDFHPWIWGGASSLWQSGHFSQAVDGAIKKLNAETQNKVGRRDISETDLFKQAFTLKPAQPSEARLRRMEDDGSRTYRNLHVGAMSYADGIFTAIRNPVSHEADFDFPEQQALEYLAALSVLARWVDDASVEKAEGTP